MAYIYFLLYSNGTIKIGCTANLKKRIRELMSNCGIVDVSPVRFLGSIDVPESDMYIRETNIHLNFMGHWRGKDDYFHCSDEIIDYISKNCNTKCREMNEYIKSRWRKCRRAKRLQELEAKMRPNIYKCNEL